MEPKEHADGTPVRALFRQTLPHDPLRNPPTVIVDGVENLRIAFGLRDGRTLRYVTPGDAGFDPARVETVRVGLLMSSFEAVTDQEDERTYVLAGQPIHASDDADDPDAHPRDRRHRLSFDTTVKVRNRRSGT